MIPLHENDSVKLVTSVKGKDIFTNQEVLLEEGETGAVVMVHGNPDNPLAYEIEFFHPERNIYVIVAVRPDQILPRN